MDSKELRNLHEAYMDVYAPQENIEEGLRSAVKRLLGGGKKEAEAPKPESRGDQLRKKYNVGPEKSDTSAKRQILDRSRAKAEKDEKDYGDKPFQKQVAQKSKAAHDRYLKAGYSKYGAGDARGRGNKAAKRAASLNREEFEYIVNALVEEGYDLSNYTWDEMYEVCLDEAVKGASRHDTEMRKAASTERKSGIKNRLSPAAGKDNANKMQRDIKFFDKLTKKNRNVVGLVTKEEVEQIDELSVGKMLAYTKTAEKNRSDLNKKWDKGTASYREKMRVLGREEGEERASKNIKKKTGKRPYEMNALDKARYAVTKEDYVDEGAAGDVAARAEKLAAQRKGQTPERKQMYASLASKASERERGGPRIIDLGGRGGRKGLTQSDRDARREYDAEYSYETGDKNSTPGPGTITKNKRKLAAQKARGQHAECYDLYDIILSHLIDEGYADTNESALVIMANMSEEWRQSIVEGDNYDKNRKRAAQRAAERNAARDAGKTGNVPGVGYVTPRRERETYVDAAGTTRHKSGAKMP
jgi:hypothetical protein